jgi:selenocysteine-specific elongation factor
MIVATAGHVDHGKSSLLRALTGADTDRLAEEKRRGMTIDLGFAWADLGAGEPVGFVDVPGHERFVRNMLAGVNRVDLALLVVAADDGPMPQTREHLAILGLLGARDLAVALTKIDRVDPTRMAEARREIVALLADTRWPSAPIFPVATPAGLGLDTLRNFVAGTAAQVRPAVPRGHFRMSIDRAFTVTGAGLVVTGTVLSGCVAVGASLQVSPAGTAARVRGIHASGRPATEAREGQRCALNIAGPSLHAEAVARGQWLLAAPLHAPVSRIDVRLRWLDTAGGPRSARSALQLHLGTAAVGALLARLGAAADDATSDTGEFAQLLLERPVSALRGDRFVLRDPASQRTLGGGEIIDPFAPARGRSRPARRAQLRALAIDEPAPALAALLADAPAGIEAEPFERAWNLDDAAAWAAADQAGALRRRIDAQTRLLAPAAWRAWQADLLAVLAHDHAQQPARLGPTEAELLRAAVTARRSQLGDREAWPERTRTAQAVARAALGELLAEGAIVREAMHLRLPDHVARLAPEDAARLARLMPLLRDSLLRPPIAGELATALGGTRDEMIAFLRRMAALGHVLPIAPNRFFAPEALAALAQVARELAAASPDGSFEAAAYRDAAGIGRNLTIEVLEFLDRAGITVFAGERRRIAGGAVVGCATH